MHITIPVSYSHFSCTVHTLFHIPYHFTPDSSSHAYFTLNFIFPFTLHTLFHMLMHVSRLQFPSTFHTLLPFSQYTSYCISYTHARCTLCFIFPCTLHTLFDIFMYIFRLQFPCTFHTLLHVSMNTSHAHARCTPHSSREHHTPSFIFHIISHPTSCLYEYFTCSCTSHSLFHISREYPHFTRFPPCN